MKAPTKIICLIMVIVLIVVVQLLNITKVQAAPMKLAQEARCYIFAIALGNAENAKKHRLAFRQYRDSDNDAVPYNIGYAQGVINTVARVFDITPSEIAQAHYTKECEVGG
jgi:hypothetical protein